MYEGWEADADQRAVDIWEGWQELQGKLSEDEEWARHVFEAFHRREDY